MTATLTLLEVRCSRCWNSNCFPVDAVGSQQGCRHCGQDILVPEATPERIARAEALLAEQPDLLEQPATSDSASPANDRSAVRAKFDRVLSDQEILELARKESYVPLEQMDFSGYPTASLVARFLASMVDQFLLVVTYALGMVMVALMARYGLAVNPFEYYRVHHTFPIGTVILVHCLPAMFAATQWVLISTSGQTLGKKLFMIRIVTTTGRLPGFIQGVVLRNWVRNLIYMLPFAGLIDCLCVLGESKRAGHDWLAGTTVIAVV